MVTQMKACGTDCLKGGSPVEYDLVSVETNELRRYGVHRYVCV